jgi:phenylalanyl-tRNA synthetase alpha chain
MPPEERRTAGAQANELKNLLESNFNARKTAMADDIVAAAARRAAIDISLPGQPSAAGRLHPITQATREICAIFATLGFQVAEGPDIENEYYNFEALNIPADHPARDSFSTFFLSPDCGQGVKCVDARNRPYLLRTHTSPVQIRTMEKVKPPVRIVAPGKVYRYEATDATHESMFHQIEGLAVDKGISFADLKGTLTDFLRLYFGQERKVRFRCDFFPFVEPGAEAAIDCFACKGAGCRLCGQSGWIEILGAGMVHPNVLRGVGIDPEIYSGFAFGVGIDRLPILRNGIDDIRLFYGNDLRFLRQF